MNSLRRFLRCLHNFITEDEIDADDSVSMTEESGFTDSGNESGSDGRCFEQKEEKSY